MPFDPETGEPIDDTNIGEGQAQGDDNRNIKLLREKAAKSDELAAQLETIQRERAIEKSGIDAETPLGKFFLENFKGDVSDLDAVKAAATELGVPVKGEAGTTTTGTGEGGEGQTGEGNAGEGAGAESNGTGERSALANGAPADEGVSPHPAKVALDAAKEAIEGGGTEEDGFEAYMRTKSAAAVAGDGRVLYDPNAE